jgi:hypothetical protein
MSDHLAGFNAAIGNWIQTTNTLAEVAIMTQRDLRQQKFQAEQARLDRDLTRERDEAQRQFTRERDTFAYDRANARDKKQFEQTIARDKMQQQFALDRIDRDQERSFQIQDKIEDRLFARDEAQSQRAQVRDLMKAQMARQEAVVSTFSPDAQMEYNKLSAELIAAMQATPSEERDRYIGVLNQQIEKLMSDNIEKGYVMRLTSPDRQMYYNLQEQINNPPSSLMPHEIPAYQEQLEQQKRKILQRAILNENSVQIDFDQRIVKTPSGLTGIMLPNGSVQVLNNPQEEMIDSALKNAIQFYQGMDVPDTVIMEMAEKTIRMKQRMLRRLNGQETPEDRISDPQQQEFERLMKLQQSIESITQRLENPKRATDK